MFDLEPRRPGGTDRRQQRTLDHVMNHGQQGEAQVSAINRVAQRALIECTMTALIRREAERLAPDHAELYSMIAMAAGMQSVFVITGLREKL